MCFWIVLAVGCFVALLLGVITYNQTRTHWFSDAHNLSRGHWVGLFLVLFSYMPELLFFLFVIEWNVPMGDYDMAQCAAGLD